MGLILTRGIITEEPPPTFGAEIPGDYICFHLSQGTDIRNYYKSSYFIKIKNKNFESLKQLYNRYFLHTFEKRIS